MIFYNVKRVCNKCQSVSILYLPSSENKIDNRERSNSWRGDRILKRILEMHDFEDIKQKQYKCFETHSAFILYMFYFRTFTTGFHKNISLLFFSTHPSCGGNPVQTDRRYCVISKITRKVSTDYVNLLFYDMHTGLVQCQTT